jgi:DNA gyrase/topoisomerase IV subunit B
VETVILQKPIPVCDLTVNKYHNFLLDSGCFVHNSHIDCLLLGHFFRHLCPLIERGHVYLGLPPLYRISEKGKYTYLRDDADLNAFMRKRSSKLVGNDKSLIALAVNANKIINQIDVIGSTYAYSPYDIGANLKAYVQSGEAKGKTHIEQLTNAIGLILCFFI